MKILFVFSLIIMLTSAAIAESKIDSVLRRKIKSMFREDQKWRLESNKLQNGKTSLYEEKTINENMRKTDSLNMIEARYIIKKYGFPGYSVVGEDGSDGFWAIVQHCDDDVVFQKKVLLLMVTEVKRHNASGDKLALLQDRVLVNQGQKQLYGTQVRVDPNTHRAKPFPIKDSLNVDSRRKAIGLGSLKDYLELFERH